MMVLWDLLCAECEHSLLLLKSSNYLCFLWRCEQRPYREDCKRFWPHNFTFGVTYLCHFLSVNDSYILWQGAYLTNLRKCSHTACWTRKSVLEYSPGVLNEVCAVYFVVYSEVIAGRCFFVNTLEREEFIS